MNKITTRQVALVKRPWHGRSFACAALLLAALVSAPAFSAGLNDTGITLCGDEIIITEANCAKSQFPRQDAHIGRDAKNKQGNLVKVGGGGKGFDFSRISNDGAVREAAALGTGSADWACTRDNTTGLIWEVKTSSGPRSVNHTYSWYSSDSTSNANFNVDPGLGICDGGCDTEGYVVTVNSVGLCGASDWRMPTVKELEGLSDFGRLNPAIDPDYFPNTKPSSPYWSGTASANLGHESSQNYAWVVNTIDGRSSAEWRATPKFVRLVRGGR